MGPRILEKMKDNIFISIITPTYNRADELIHLFRSISDKTYPLEKIEEIGSITLIGQLLFTEYVLPFEIISILLLVAVIGAVVIAKRRFN